MADTPRQWQQLRGGNSDYESSESYGDCEADPVPALWFQDDEDMNTDSGIIDRFWLPLAIAVLAGWGSITYVLVNSFGWMVILAVAGVVVAGTAAAVVLVKTGDRDVAEVPARSRSESDERHYRNAA